MPGERALRIVVCGTDFGRTYLSALAARPGFELVGIMARGSERSHRCARHHGVPLYHTADDLPSTVDAAAVVVSAAINGGPGGAIARDLMAKGLHVLQEHPLDQQELAQCLRSARRHGVVYQVNSHYRRLPAVVRFLLASDRLLAHQKALHLDAQSSFLVLYPLLDILAGAVGTVRPFSVTGPATGPSMLRAVSGTLGGVPLTLRVQHQLDPVNRDNGAHLLHRITLYTEGGSLHLSGPDGPVIWNPRFYRPRDYADVVDVADSGDSGLDLPAFEVLDAPNGDQGGPVADTYRSVVGVRWPDAVGVALDEFRSAVLSDVDPLPRGQYHLALAQAAARVVECLGPPELMVTNPPDVAGAFAAVTGRDPTTGRAEAAKPALARPASAHLG